jgi:hypothetical protein
MLIKRVCQERDNSQSNASNHLHRKLLGKEREREREREGERERDRDPITAHKPDA